MLYAQPDWVSLRWHVSAPNICDTLGEAAACVWVLMTKHACRMHFHTQLADKANQTNSDDVKQLLQAVYDIMAPEGQ